MDNDVFNQVLRLVSKSADSTGVVTYLKNGYRLAEFNPNQADKLDNALRTKFRLDIYSIWTNGK